MNTVLDEVTSDAIDAKHVERRVEDWEARLKGLYATIGAWLPDDWEARRGAPVRMHEKTMREFGVAARQMPTLELHRRTGEVVRLRGTAVTALRPALPTPVAREDQPRTNSWTCGLDPRIGACSPTSRAAPHRHAYIFRGRRREAVDAPGSASGFTKDIGAVRAPHRYFSVTRGRSSRAGVGRSSTAGFRAFPGTIALARPRGFGLGDRRFLTGRCADWTESRRVNRKRTVGYRQ